MGLGVLAQLGVFRLVEQREFELLEVDERHLEAPVLHRATVKPLPDREPHPPGPGADHDDVELEHGPCVYSGPMLAVDAVRGLLLSVAVAAEPAATATEPLTLEVANRAVFTFQVAAQGIPAAERLTLARGRLESIPRQDLEGEVTVRPLQIGQERAAAIFLGSRFLFHVTPADAAAAGGSGVQALAEQAAAALREALKAEREQHSLPLILRGLLWSAVATGGAAGLLWVLVRGRRLGRAGIHHATASRDGWRRWGVDFAPAMRSLLNGLVFLVFWLLLLSVIEVWLTYVLSQFPATRPWSDALLGGVL